MSRPAKRVTIREVADAAGLSPAAVSYALRGIQVSAETQAQVRKLATQLGYEAHPIARALASGRTRMVGILGPSLEDLWQQRVAAEAGRALLARDRYALIVDAGGDPVRQRELAAQLRDQRVDGLILSPVDPSDPFWSELAESLAVVCFGDAPVGAATIGQVLFDNRTGVTGALEHLHGLGHRRIAVLRRPSSPTAGRPADGYVETVVKRLRLEPTIVDVPYGLHDGTAVVRDSLLGADRRPTAAFCFSDSIAYSVYAAARELKLAIPRDLSVVGYDDHPISAVLTPPLTSFDWQSKHLVEVAVGMVVAAIDGRRARRRVVIEPTLRERGSTAARPRS